MRVYTRLLKILLPVTTTALLTGSCEKKNDPDLIPSYIHINQLGITTGYDQGTSSSKITDAWVYIDETLIGAFELPATVPVLSEGTQSVTIRPGIKINGISNTRSIYPFYKDLKRTVVLVRDSIVNFNDTLTTYKDNVVFPWLESFDLTGITLDTTSKSTVAITKISDSDKIFHKTGEYNSHSGYVHMAIDGDIFEAATVQKYAFPGNGTAIFLEMNYKTNQDLVVGVFYTASGIRVQRPLLVLNPTDSWKKVYVNLTVPKYDTPSAYDFQIFFGSQKEEGSEEGDIYLDNLKLVHFNTSK